MKEEEEEGEYEYASYHGEGSSAAQNASFGPGVEVQEAEGESHAEVDPGVVRLCTHDREVKEVPCARYASIFGKAFGWIKRHAKHLVAAGIGFVTGAALGVGTVFATAACVAGTDGLESVECAKIAMAGGAASMGGFAAGVGALSSELHEWFR